MQTVFVVGAGASREVSLPTGHELKSYIAASLDFQVDRVGRQHGGDVELFSTIAALANEAKVPLGEYLQYTAQIRSMMPLAQSIDHFLDNHRDNEHLVACGKSAIARAILNAEAKSKLAFLKRNAAPDFGKLEDTWYLLFFQKLVEGCNKNDLSKRFESVTLIIFNYDRCIEWFLYYALTHFFNLDRDAVSGLIKKMNVFRPYGSLGDLPQISKDRLDMDFGATPSPGNLLSIRKNIKIFTEQTDPSSKEITALRKKVGRADRLVFLGFAYHDLNMNLLDPKPNFLSDEQKNILGTAFARSDYEREVITEVVARLYNHEKIARLYISPNSCFEFFREYDKALTF